MSEAQNIVAVTGARIERLDDIADGADGADQAPEGAEQTEKHQQADEITRGITRFVESCCDGIEDGPLRDRGKPDFAALADQRAHRRKQFWRTADLFDAAGSTKGIEPADFRAQAHRLRKHQNDADGQHAENEAVEPRIGHEGGVRLPIENGRQKADEDQKQNHRPEKRCGAGQLVAVLPCGHRFLDAKIEQPESAITFAFPLVRYPAEAI